MLKIIAGIRTDIDKVLHLKGISTPAQGGMLQSLYTEERRWGTYSSCTKIFSFLEKPKSNV